jgi:mono/diheme cytochrome c family protein
MKTILAMLIIGVFTCSFVISAFTQDSAKGSPGEVLLKENCAACHPNGGNVINPNKPLKGAQTLNTFETFLSWIRKPIQPMPPFPPSKISDQQAKELYDYLLKETKGVWK